MPRVRRPYPGPAGGWGSVRSLARKAIESNARPSVAIQLARQNKPDGFACVSCAWAKPARPHPAEFCENGAKATFWELTASRATPDFFAAHTLTELRGWTDHDLERAGRLTHPMRYDRATDRYVPASWDEAFAAIGSGLRALRREDPKQVVFYASGRASLETSYLWQLFARMFGNNNLPDSSNMCHETTSVALPESIGAPVGTVRLDDFDKADAIFFFGQNVGSNSPRMLHPLRAASRRGARVVTFNPLRERGLERFTDPQNPLEMALHSETRISGRYFQVRAGGDIAAIAGICKALLALEEERGGILDHAFIADHCHGFDAFRDFLLAQDWAELEAESALSRADMAAAAGIYAAAGRVIGIYGMGLTQHRRGVASVQMLVNLLLLRGNIGRDGAGVCPVRGHSNVQGQRTVGITEKPHLAPLDRLAELYHFDPPREEGLTTVEACRAILDGRVRGFVGLGGNFLRAVPDHGPMEEAWPRQRLTAHVATKLNRSHLFPGETCWLLPCLGRIERDEQESGPQAVTIEDSTACFHASRGEAEPASGHLLSEPQIVARLAVATLGETPHVPWMGWAADYARIRDAMEATWPDMFRDFNARMWTRGGIPRDLPARRREWRTGTGRANFLTPGALSASWAEGAGRDVFRLITLRSNDQFNTTVYGYSDRFRGVEGTRSVVFINPGDMTALGLTEGDPLILETVAEDNVRRRLGGLLATPYDIPRGCVAGYYPECNVLLPLDQYAEGSKVPAAKSIPVRITR